ncbi:TetR/AcrR family transcriptional regulator [Luteipulveratus mongoliensis]|uniref:TetR family transcriptional regulator n=1 Tax=Luteipulveratus mongoliensis TaxID=571913 RepID=A0A0K1JM59_9MICO|nr:TetR/AcrR family transcriptional regulator [Luteipulveratus mongoliensis]AKU17675.1 TetR family transcriptional regulator [Luteipulveratus mongoliensis]
MTKGLETRELVLREALAQSSHLGLKGLSIGALATSLEMSKSGLFAHFRSKEQLQTDVLAFAGDGIRRLVLEPAIAEPRGEPRIRKLFERWIGWEGYADYALPGGCVFVEASREFDDEPEGPVRDTLVRLQRDWLDSVETIFRTGISEEHLRADADPRQLAYDLNAIMLGFHFSTRLLRDPDAAMRAERAFERLLDDHRP